MNTKKNYYWALASFFLLTFSFTSKKQVDCSKIKNGSFYYYSKGIGDKIDIERIDGIQIESNTKTGHVLKNKIVWKDKCTYDMYINALSESKLDKMDSLLATLPASVEIVSVDLDHYVCKWNMKILNKELGGTDTIYFKKAH